MNPTDLIPAGRYYCRIDRATEKVALSGKPYFDLVLSIQEGEHAGKSVRDRIFFSEKALRRAQAFLLALGLQLEGECRVGPNDVLGRLCYVNIQTESDPKGTQNKVAYDGYECARELLVTNPAELAAAPRLPQFLTPIPEGIPQELRDRDQWVCWVPELRRHERTGELKWTKVPKCVLNGANASSTDPNTWTSFKGVFAAYGRGGYAGIGYVFSKDDPYCGIDFDKALDETGNLKEWAIPDIANLNSFTEISPGRSGVHVIVRGKLPGKGRKWGFEDHAVEAYDQSRYFTFSGHPFTGRVGEIERASQVIEDRPDQAVVLYEKHDRLRAEAKEAKRKPSVRPQGPSPQESTPSTLSDEQILELARRARNGAKFEALWNGDIAGYPSQSEADLALCSMLAFFTGPDPGRISALFCQSKLDRSKWNEPRGDATYGQRTINQALAGKTEFYNPSRRSPPPDLAALPGLIEQVKANPGALDSEDVLEALAYLYAMKPGEYERIVRDLKKAGIRTKAFEPRVAKKAREYGPHAAKAKEYSPPPATKVEHNWEALSAETPPIGTPPTEGPLDEAPDEKFDPGLPKIAWEEGFEDLPKMTILGWWAVENANIPPQLYLHAGAPARIKRVEGDSPAIEALTPTKLRYHLARAAIWWKTKGSGKSEVSGRAAPPMAVVHDALAMRDPPLPLLLGISECPTFAADGFLHAENGYSERSKLFLELAEGLVIPEVSEAPSQAEIAKARELLEVEVFGEFPFAAEGDRAHVISAVLQPFVRAFITGPTPLHVVEKPSPGTGATLLVDIIGIISAGRALPMMTEGKDEDEWRKRIFAKLRSGPSIIVIDNVRNTLDSAAFSSAITAWPSWEDRILGVSETARVPVRCLWIATGNNPTMSYEISRRTIRIRLDALVERPWLRVGFRHPELRSWVMENRGQLIWAVLTLVRAWLAAGRPMGKATLGMFESWAMVIGGILNVAGVGGFLEDIEKYYAVADEESSSWLAFLVEWWDVHGGALVSVAQLHAIATKHEGVDLGDGREHSQKTRLGLLLRKRHHRVVKIEKEGQAPFLVRIESEPNAHSKVTLWQLKVYNPPHPPQGPAQPPARLNPETNTACEGLRGVAGPFPNPIEGHHVRACARAQVRFSIDDVERGSNPPQPPAGPAEVTQAPVAEGPVVAENLRGVEGGDSEGPAPPAGSEYPAPGVPPPAAPVVEPPPHWEVTL